VPRYALHRDAQDPDHLVLVERWRSQADLDEHMTKPYVADLFAVAGTPGMLAGAPSLSFLQPLGVGDPAKGSL
jgi:quinol monooxygenase YgiN